MSDEVLQSFPPGFLWGAATSAHQVEGGNTLNDWARFEAASGGTLCSGDACRHWERFDADFALAAADGHRMHRLSIEWSRLEPRPGSFDPAAVDHYHQVFASLARHRIVPMVTLHHFTVPLWLADRGGFEDPAAIEAFERFARFAGREYGGEVDWWCTVNEPDVYGFRGWSEGSWPPEVRDDSRALAVIAHLLEAHARAARALREEDGRDADGDGHATRIGFAKHVVQLEPAHPWSPLDRLRARLEDAVFNEALLRAARDGVVHLAIPGARTVHREIDDLAGSLDWLGVNYYTRWKVQAIGATPHVARRGAPLNDLGWEIWPAGLARAVERAAGVGVPMVVTEHGFADAADRLRPRALVESLTQLGAAIARGAPVLGYLHWSLLDNFEWAEGWNGRFGLYRVDVDDPERPRTRTRSAALYADVIRANGVTRAIAEAAGASAPDD